MPAIRTRFFTLITLTRFFTFIILIVNDCRYVLQSEKNLEHKIILRGKPKFVYCLQDLNQTRVK